MPSDPLADIVWTALTTGHRDLALISGRARKYPADIAPFAALSENSSTAAADLHSLLQPGEMNYLASDEPIAAAPGLTSTGSLLTVQMLWPEHIPIPEPEPGEPDDIQIVPLTCYDSAEMLGLIAIAFPGFFRERTCLMGPYSGIRSARGTGNSPGKLIAMAGDRMVTDNLREISGLCTHPDHTGRGLARRLITHKLREHRDRGYGSFLHTAAANTRAIGLYERMGFIHTRQFHLQRIVRTDETSAPAST